MAQLRRDPVVGRWCIIADESESWGPSRYPLEPFVFTQTAICPFCPGREKDTPHEVDAIRPKESSANDPNWLARVVPNKFPALRIEGDVNPRCDGVFDAMDGVGAHEIVIEGRDHRRHLADFSVDEIDRVLTLYQNRLNDLAGDTRFKYIMIFRNHRQAAGASLEHAHSQIIALPMVPWFVLREIEGAQNYYHQYERCVYCDMIRQETGAQERLVCENERYVALCPFVSRYSFETWVLPKEHGEDFARISAGERHSLADLLKKVLSRLKEILNDPPYNFYFHISPVRRAMTYHWHIEIIPQLMREAGFEWGTGFYVVRTNPTHAARCLREVEVKV